jgi:hypothetical protein
MECCDQDNTSDEEINAVIDKMLAEDERERLLSNPSSANKDSFTNFEERDVLSMKISFTLIMLYENFCLFINRYTA